jgi:hypothetical protein
MLSRPRIGQAVRLHYAARKRKGAPHHGSLGTVVVVARGPGPRNHGVRIGGEIVVVPCGQLNGFKPPC